MRYGKANRYGLVLALLFVLGLWAFDAPSWAASKTLQWDYRQGALQTNDRAQKFGLDSNADWQFTGGHVVPATDNGKDLGTSSKSWRTVYADTSVLINGNAAKAVGDETSGIIVPSNLSELDITASTAPTLTRNAQGDWSYNRTAGGAETLRFATTVPYLINTASKGAKLTGVRCIYELGVADATSHDMLVDSATYAQITDPVVAALGGAIVDGDYDSNHNTAGKRKDSTVANGEHVETLTLNTPTYLVGASTFARIEATFVLQNTGTLKLRGLWPIYTQKER